MSVTGISSDIQMTIVSQIETVAVLSGYFHFGKYHDQSFGFSELLTISKMEIVVQLLHNLQQLK